MLKTLLYLNLILAVVYFLTWLQEGSRTAITGIIFIVLFCGYTLWAVEREKWRILNYVATVPVLVFSRFLLLSGINLAVSSLKNGYRPAGLVLLYVYSIVFGLTLFIHVLLLVAKTLRSRKHKNNSSTV